MDLTRKNTPTKTEWSLELDAAFGSLKSELCLSPVLASPDFNWLFILRGGASDWGVGAVLSQCDDSGLDHPVVYFSRKSLAQEEHYSTVEKECLAIKLGVKTFKVYLLGKPFTVQMDHRAFGVAWSVEGGQCLFDQMELIVTTVLVCLSSCWKGKHECWCFILNRLFDQCDKLAHYFVAGEGEECKGLKLLFSWVVYLECLLLLSCMIM